MSRRSVVTLAVLLFLACQPEKTVRAPDTSANRPPVVNSGGPYTGVEGSAVNVTAQASDPDGDSLSYAWDFADGGTASGIATAHTYANNGNYTATVIVTDSRGVADTASAAVTVTNAPPQITAVTVPTAPIAIGE